MPQVNPDVYRALVLKQALKVHVKTNGTMRLTRMASPTQLLKMATEYTGKQYRRGQQAQALTDLEEVLDKVVAV
jgi:hypothetical protein